MGPSRKKRTSRRLGPREVVSVQVFIEGLQANGEVVLVKRLMTIAEYAAHRKSRGLSGGTRVAIYKAIKTRRIQIDESGLVDAIEADRMWAERTAIRMPPMRMF